MVKRRKKRENVKERLKDMRDRMRRFNVYVFGELEREETVEVIFERIIVENF